MTEQKFIERIYKARRNDYTREQVADLVTTVFDELKEVIREGDELRIKRLGRWYPKMMKKREVKGGWSKTLKTYVVQPKTKIGFSSYNCADAYVSTPIDGAKRKIDRTELMRLWSEDK